MTSDRRWSLDEAVIFLNHGSYGACPRAVLEAQGQLRERLERDPVRFFSHEVAPLWRAAREDLARFLNAEPAGLAFVNNATTGVNTVLASLDWRPGDEILVIDQGYRACLNAAAYAADRWGAKRVVASVPFPISSSQEAYDAVVGGATERTRLAIIDHVTSPTGLVLPVKEIVAELQGRGIDVLVDGAHAPGMVDLDLSALGAAYYTGNCHKWLCTPKGAAFLFVREDRRKRIRPLVISHGASAPEAQRFHREFDWVGTDDPTAVLTIPTAIEYLGHQVEGGWPALRKRNRQLCIEARRILLDRLEVDPPCPEEMIGSIAAVPLPDSRAPAPDAENMDPLHAQLYERHNIQVPVFCWPAHPKRLLRISAQLYNRVDEYERLAEVLRFG